MFRKINDIIRPQKLQLKCNNFVEFVNFRAVNFMIITICTMILWTMLKNFHDMIIMGIDIAVS